ncbi:uncharacterized protein ACNS7B_019714 [Menidia menidia]
MASGDGDLYLLHGSRCLPDGVIPSAEAHELLLLLHGNHLLVSLSCSAASLIHNSPHFSNTRTDAAARTSDRPLPCCLSLFSPLQLFASSPIESILTGITGFIWQERNCPSLCSWLQHLLPQSRNEYSGSNLRVKHEEDDHIQCVMSSDP